MKVSVPPGTKTYSIRLVDPLKISSSATFSQTLAATPLMNLGTSTATPGTSVSVTLSQTTLPSASPTKVYVFNVLDPENLN